MIDAPPNYERGLLALLRQKQRLQAELKTVETEIGLIQANIIDAWTEAGITQTRVDGTTLYVRRQAFATVADYDRAREILRAEGLDALNRPNTMQLSAWLREREKNGEPIPDSFEGVIGLHERYSVAARGLGGGD